MSFKDFLRELAVEIAAFVAAAAFIVVVAVRYSGWAALVGSVLLIAFSVYKIVKFFNIRNRERQLRDMGVAQPRRDRRRFRQRFSHAYARVRRRRDNRAFQQKLFPYFYG